MIRQYRLNVRSVLVLLVSLLTTSAEAALSCYNDSIVPSVERVRRIDGALTIRLGGALAGMPELPQFRWSGQSWQPITAAKKPIHDDATPCPAAFLSKNYGGVSDFENLPPEIHCANTGGHTYGGISFYDGEGMDGVGGLLWQSGGGKVVYRLPAVLKGRSVSALVARGSQVWFGTAKYFECSGALFEAGLVRYDWRTGETQTFEGTDDGPLGFEINDLLLDDAALWVATDLGISRLDLSTHQWAHWTATARDRQVTVRATSPEELYRKLLDETPRERLVTEIYDNQLVEGLALFRPRFLHRYLASVSAGRWDCASARFLGGRMSSFDAFKARVARHVSERVLECAIGGFARTRNREAGFRDYLVQLDAANVTAKREPLAAEVFREFRNDAIVEKHLLARLDEDVVRMLPLVMGERSIPILRRELDRDSRWGGVRHDVIYALELATHRRILPAGTLQPLPAGSDRPWYVDVASDNFNSRWYRYDKSEREAVAKRWRDFLDAPRGGSGGVAATALRPEDQSVLTSVTQYLLGDAPSQLKHLYVDRESQVLSAGYATSAFEHLNSETERQLRARPEFAALLKANRAAATLDPLQLPKVNVTAEPSARLRCETDGVDTYNVEADYSMIAKLSRPGYSRDHTTALVAIHVEDCMSGSDSAALLEYAIGWRVSQVFILHSWGE